MSDFNTPLFFPEADVDVDSPELLRAKDFLLDSEVAEGDGTTVAYDPAEVNALVSVLFHQPKEAERLDLEIQPPSNMRLWRLAESDWQWIRPLKEEK